MKKLTQATVPLRHNVTNECERLVSNLASARVTCVCSMQHVCVKGVNCAACGSEIACASVSKIASVSSISSASKITGASKLRERVILIN